MAPKGLMAALTAVREDETPSVSGLRSAAGALREALAADDDEAVEEALVTAFELLEARKSREE